MLAPAVLFSQVVVAIHVVFVVVAFGALLTYPVIAIAAERLDRRSVPLLHRVRKVIGRSLVNPGMVIVVIAGIYLASDLHDWHEFFVQWGLGAVIVIGALEGAFVIRESGRLADIAQRDIDAAGGGEIKWSEEYALMAVIVIVTVFLMVVQ
jgi:hypothetical protein